MKYGSTVYICGPMRGKPCMNFEEFFYWARLLRRSGYKVINPAEHDCERMFGGWVWDESKYEEVLQEDLRLITEYAQWLFVLKGWEDSDGANREIEHARNLGLSIFYEDKRKGHYETPVH